ncbi:DUF937 domain-containing protein [Sphingomonas cavernae]|uniref:DUF937 domain-containing protein n=1 Tax=Sphingomonas cavernae TaxID=2320861 RepID=A0A418WJR6_9SPHN|nr:DUF937 domain-containing protein [Sphingomonas cavernae]RJF90286.1 DUF937 domain-containing protein [Sphingomonas cavernae]
MQRNILDFNVINSVAKEMNISPAMVQTGAEVLLPAILGGFKKQAGAHAGGLDALVGTLGGLGGGGLLEAVTSISATPMEPGNEILGQIFGSKDVSRTVADHAAQSSGLDPSLLKKMLPLLAMAVGGLMSAQAQAGSQSGVAANGTGAGSLLGQLLGGFLGGNSSGGDGQAAGISGVASMLDLDGDGNPLDDILSVAGKLHG